MNDHIIGHEQAVTVRQGVIPRSVLLIEPDDRVGSALSSSFHRKGWDVVRRDYDCIERCHPIPEHVILALSDSPMASLEPLGKMKRLYPESKVTVTLAYTSTRVIVDCMRMGAHDCLIKPLAPEEVFLALAGRNARSTDCSSSTLPSLAKMEWEYLSRVLCLHAGNISQSARTLGIRRTTLQRKLKKYPPTR